MSDSVIVYTRLGCHLCESAAEILKSHGLAPRLVDIDQDPELVERYDECVPVVVIDGRERFIHEKDVRFDRQCASKAAALLHAS